MGEPRYTEKEMVMAQRGAAVLMANALRNRAYYAPWKDGASAVSAVIAAELFPLPKVERPRVVTDPHSPNSKWRVDRDTLQVSPYDEPLPWRAYPHDDNSFTVTPERVAMWADLLSHPSEFVDDEG